MEPDTTQEAPAKKERKAANPLTIVHYDPNGDVAEVPAVIHHLKDAMDLIRKEGKPGEYVITRELARVRIEEVSNRKITIA